MVAVDVFSAAEGRSRILLARLLRDGATVALLLVIALAPLALRLWLLLR